MRGALHLAAIAAVALAAGCTTTVDVAFDDDQDFAQFQTWDWLPGAKSVDALPWEEEGLGALTSRLVDGGFKGRGLAHREDGADLLVGYDLRVRRELVTVNETGAQGLLSSHNSDGAYLIQATERRFEVYDVGYLQIVVTDGRRERVIWRGELWARHRGDFADRLPDAVSRLLAEFPAAPGD